MANHQNHAQNGLKQAQVAVVMVPFPAHGHLNQLLHLSRLVLSLGQDIPVHYIGTALQNRQAKLRVHGWNPIAVKNLHFHDFTIPPFVSPPPNPNASNKFPSHLQPLFDASAHLREPVGALLRELSSKARRVIVVHDSVMASVVQDIVSIPNGESYTFHSVSPFTVYLYIWEAMGKAVEDIANIPKDIPSLEGCFTNEFLDFVASEYEFKFSSGDVYNTSRVIESTYMDLLDKETVGATRKHWALGPFNPVTISERESANDRNFCLEWLDKQAPRSVLYVSFGTTTAMDDEQIRELAFGLEESKQKFIWVLRDADKGDVFEGGVRRAELPKGFEERVKDMGLIVRDWAPQLEILGHPSTGGFMSHCGWNSCMESISMGVPIAAWPMHSDQPRNTVLITQVLKVGLVVRDWARRDELVASPTVEEAAKKLMATKEGDAIRKRAAELGDAVQRSMDKGGVSRMELDSFIAHVTR